jgi:F0F1-type ATP synthase membrane subunit b/b'
LADTTIAPGRKKEPLGKRVGAGLKARAQTVKGTIDDATGALAEGTAGLRSSAQSLANPLGLALGGLAAGFLIGLVIPSTEYEDERLPEIREAIVGRGQEIAQDAIDHGRAVLDDTLAAATSSAQEHGQQFFSDLQKEAGDNGDNASQTNENANQNPSEFSEN